MNYLGININLRKKVEDLSPAQRKIIEILKILNIKPKIIILDEPTAALSDRERKLLFNVMNRCKQEGIGMIFITHYLDEVINMSDRITVLRNGASVGMMKQNEINKKDIIKLMINREQTTEYPEKNGKIGNVVLEVENLSDGHRVFSVNFKYIKVNLLAFSVLWRRSIRNG